jgi:hypothetical protein
MITVKELKGRLVMLRVLIFTCRKYQLGQAGEVTIKIVKSSGELVAGVKTPSTHVLLRTFVSISLPVVFCTYSIIEEIMGPRPSNSLRTLYNGGTAFTIKRILNLRYSKAYYSNRLAQSFQQLEDFVHDRRFKASYISQ